MPPPGSEKNGTTGVKDEPGVPPGCPDEPEGNAGGAENAARYGVEMDGENSGVSNTLGAGSTRALGRTGRAETRLPQRVLAIERPSVNNVSPFASANFFLVQKTLLPMR